MRIFLAGATGVIGRRVTRLLIDAGHELTAVGRTPEKRRALAQAGATPSEVDLFNAGAVKQAVAGHEVVINLATHIPPVAQMGLPDAWDENARIRRFMSANLSEAASAGGAIRFIQESISLIYPDYGAEWIDESIPLEPTATTGSVLDAEAAAQRFTTGGRTGIVLRFASFYGPDTDRTLEMIQMTRQGLAPLSGPAEGYISSIHLDDAAQSVLAALGVEAGIYNVGDDEPLRRYEYSAALASALGVPPPEVAGAGEGMAGRSLRVSNRKLRQDSGRSPRYPSAREGWKAILNELNAQAI